VLLARVEARVWVTREIPFLSGRTTLAVTDVLTGARHVAVDLVGAGAGDYVLMATGSPASQAVGGGPVDAAIVAMVEGTDALKGLPETPAA
jgi:ethanolamine utilization protein EutN